MGMDARPHVEAGAVELIIGCVFFMLFMSILLLLFFYFSKKKIIQKELEKSNLELAYQKDLLEATLMVQEEERKRIARDLHDDISSKLNIVTLNCHMLSMGGLTAEKESGAIQNIVSLSSKALESSRNIAHGLFPPVFDQFGLDAAIQELCGEFNSSKSLHVNYKSSVPFNEEEKDRHLHVFRILQELMNNSQRHGKATVVDIEFEEDNGKIACIYNDNGKGFDINEVKILKGLGMKNIESRINFLKGSITIDSKPNEGIKVIFSF